MGIQSPFLSVVLLVTLMDWPYFSFGKFTNTDYTSYWFPVFLTIHLFSNRLERWRTLHIEQWHPSPRFLNGTQRLISGANKYAYFDKMLFRTACFHQCS